METVTREMRMCMGRDGSGEEDGPTGEGGRRWKAMGRGGHGDQDSTWCPALPGDLEAAAAGGASNYMAEFPSPETAQHLSLLKPGNVRVMPVNWGCVRFAVGNTQLLSQVLA